MTTIKVFEYKYEVICEDDPTAQYFCNTYEEAHELFCELIGGGYVPFIKSNDKFNAEIYERTKRDILRKIITRNV